MSIIFIRTIILYLLIVFSLRVMGKRQLAELQPSEFVVTILISNVATLPLEDINIPLIGGVVPILLLVSFEVLVSFITLKSQRARKIVACYGLGWLLFWAMERRGLKSKIFLNQYS